MLLIEWLAGIIIATIIVVLSRIHRWPESQSADIQRPIRLIAISISVILVIAGIILLQMQIAHFTSLADAWSGFVLSTGVLAGSIFYLHGVLKWYGKNASKKRKVGWIMLLVSFIVPTMMTLLMPLIVLMGTLIGQFHLLKNDPEIF